MIAIIGVLVGMLLPAVQQAREAGRRISCSNNMRQMGIALHNYANVHEGFPVGWESGGDQNAEWGWPVFILPMLEEQVLYDNLGVGTRTLRDVIADASPLQLLQTRISRFRCPTDITPALQPGSSNAGPTYNRLFDCDNYPADFKPATSNDVGNGGLGNPEPVIGINGNGAFWVEKPVRLVNITNGLSKTFAGGNRGVHAG